MPGSGHPKKTIGERMKKVKKYKQKADIYNKYDSVKAAVEKARQQIIDSTDIVIQQIDSEILEEKNKIASIKQNHPDYSVSSFFLDSIRKIENEIKKKETKKTRIQKGLAQKLETQSKKEKDFLGRQGPITQRRLQLMLPEDIVYKNAVMRRLSKYQTKLNKARNARRAPPPSQPLAGESVDHTHSSSRGFRDELLDDLSDYESDDE